MLLNLFIPFLASAGFAIAFYIFHKKRTAQPLICPLHGSCHTVIHSDYATCVGVPVECLGMFYYGFLLAIYSLILLFPPLAIPSISIALFGLTTSAWIFSLYLTFVQSTILKHWCTWCLISAGLCTILFVHGWMQLS